MEKGNSISKKNENTSVGVSSKSDLQNLIKRTNEELIRLNQAIQDSKSFEYSDEKVSSFAKKLLGKYSHSVINIDGPRLSTDKSIWIYAKDYIDLGSYEEELTASSITLSHVDFHVLLEKTRENVRNDIKVFINETLSCINSAINFDYCFYLLDIIVKDFAFNEDSKTLKAQIELFIDIQ